MATDPDEGIYPLAWAWVEAENNNSWDWFISLLKNDLRIQNSGGYTFISDRHKVKYQLISCNFVSLSTDFVLIQCLRQLICRAW